MQEKPIFGEEFSDDEIAQSIRDNKVLNVDLETNLNCNARCIYCFRNVDEVQQKSIPCYEIILSRIDKIIAAGAKTISIVGGGEPTLYKSKEYNLINIVEYIRDRGVSVGIFTNGLIFGKDSACNKLFSMDPDKLIKRLFDLQATVFLKTHSLNKIVYDKLIGIPDAFQYFDLALSRFLNSEYSKADYPQLVFQCTIMEDNLEEIPSLWKFVRQKNIVPSFELGRPSGCAKINNVTIDAMKARLLFEDIARIDKEQFGFEWVPIPPYLGYTCNLNKFCLYVDVNGNVFNCEGMCFKLGNIDEDILKNLIESSEELKRMRELKKWIRGKCQTCDFFNSNYCFGGCRGHAFEMTGDAFASDPICWQSTQQNVPEE